MVCAIKTKSRVARIALLAIMTLRQQTQDTRDYPEANFDCDGVCLNDADADGICDEFEVAGCTDASACNYAAAATDDDGVARMLRLVMRAMEVGFDSDSDGVCDQNEVTGCQDSTACNYDSTVTDAGTVITPKRITIVLALA